LIPDILSKYPQAIVDRLGSCAHGWVEGILVLRGSVHGGENKQDEI
jgi:hypothetical protein